MVFNPKRPLEKSRSWTSRFSVFFILVLFGGLVTSSQWKPHTEVSRGLAAVETSSAQSYDYLEMLDLRKYLSENPQNTPPDGATRQFWKNHFRALFANEELRAEFEQLNDPTEDGSPAIKNLALFVNHTRNFRGEKLPAEDLVKKIVEFIDAAEKESTD